LLPSNASKVAYKFKKKHHSKLTDSIILLHDIACPTVAHTADGQQNIK
jgi:hypothetical protein